MTVPALGIPIHLAQSAATRAEAVSILTWLIVIVGVGVAAAVVGFFIWRAYNRQEDTPLTPATAFTLADLRRLRREGQLSDEEFERARAAIIARTRAGLAPPDDAATEPGEVAPDSPPAEDESADDAGDVCEDDSDKPPVR